MALALAILTFLTAAVPLIFWLLQRRAARADDPLVHRAAREQAIAREILRDDERGANRSLADDLQRLRDVQGRQPGQSGAADGGGQAVHPAG